MSRFVKFSTDSSTGQVTIAEQREPKVADLVTTAVSTDSVLTGVWGLGQRIGMVYASLVGGQVMAGRPVGQAAKLGFGN